MGQPVRVEERQHGTAELDAQSGNKILDEGQQHPPCEPEDPGSDISALESLLVFRFPLLLLFRLLQMV